MKKKEKEKIFQKQQFSTLPPPPFEAQSHTFEGKKKKREKKNRTKDREPLKNDSRWPEFSRTNRSSSKGEESLSLSSSNLPHDPSLFPSFITLP